MAVDAARAKSLFLAASDLQDVAERAVYLDRECGSDAALRVRVEALLRANDASPLEPARAADETGTCAPDQPETADSSGKDENVGATLGGKYKLIEEIGEGGMGSVYMAQQTEPVRRAVAVKVIKAGMDSKAVLARFEAERQALAMMDHPNIARVLDAGTTDSGRPYFVMELVKGVPITQYCDERKLTPRQRLELFIPVCNAIQHAHQKGVIHRDIKPNNVLVALYDDKPVPKVIDFGVAKAAGSTLTDKTLMTGFGAVVGTPEYMSPEQANLNNLDIDTRSDVYSLGVLLYELLTGSTPVDRKSLDKAALLEILRIVREVEAPRPSAKLSAIATLPSVAANRGTEPARLSKLMKGELDWVMLKALEKDRTRRYDTANGLARDIQRYLADEVVEARPPSTGYRLKKFVRRHKGQVVAASLVLLALVVGVVGTTLGLLEARRQTEFAREQEAEAVKQAGLARDEAAEKERQRGIAEENERQAVAARGEEARQRAAAEAEKKKAVEFRDKALDALQATTGEDVEKLLGEKLELGANEKAYLEAIAKRWQAFAEQMGTDEDSRKYQAEGRVRVGTLWGKLGRHEEARTEFLIARDLYRKLVEDFPDVPQHQSRLAHTSNNLGHDLAKLGQREAAVAEHRAAIKLNETLVARYPGEIDYEVDLADCRSNLGVVLDEMGEREQAMTEYRAAHEFRKKHVARFPEHPDYLRRLAASHNNLGMLLHDAKQLAQSLVEYRSACDLHAKLMARFPGVAEHQDRLAVSRSNLGAVLYTLNRNEEAAAEHRAARDLQMKLAERYPTVPTYHEGLALAHFNLAVVLTDLGKPAEAHMECDSCVKLRERLVAQFPTVPVYRKRLADARLKLGNTLSTLGEPAKAEAEYQAAQRLVESLIKSFPDEAEYRDLMAKVQYQTGYLLAKQGKRAEALIEFQSARDIQKTLVEKFPKRVEYRKHLADTCDMLGCVLTNLKKWEESRTELKAALDLKVKLVEQFPGDTNYQISLGGAYCNYAMIFLREGQPSKGLEWFDRAIGVLQPVYEREPQNTIAWDFLRNSHWSRSQAYEFLMTHRECLEDWDRVVELSPPAERAKLRGRRAILRFKAGMFAEAVADVQEGMEADRWTVLEQYNFACICAVASGKIADKKSEYTDRAMELLAKAVKAGYKDAAHMKKDSDLDALREREDFKQLLADLDAKLPPKTETAPKPPVKK